MNVSVLLFCCLLSVGFYCYLVDLLDCLGYRLIACCLGLSLRVCLWVIDVLCMFITFALI